MINFSKKGLLVTAALLTLAAGVWAQPPDRPRRRPRPEIPRTPQQQSPAPAPQSPNPAPPASGVPVKPGAGEPAPPLLRGQAGRVRGGPVRMNYDNLDIRVMAKLVSEITGRNLVVDDRVNGKITLLSSRDMSPTEIYDIFRVALDRYGFAIKQQRGYELIVPVADARRTAPAVPIGQARGANPVLGLILLKNADVQAMQTALKPLVADANLLQAYQPARALIVIDTPSVVRRVAQLARQMDAATAFTSVKVIKLKYAESDKLAPVLQAVITRTGGTTDQSALPPPKVGSFAPANSLVVQGTAEQVATAERMAKKLDLPRSAPDQLEKPQFYVRFLQYAKAEDTAKTLSSILGDTQEAQKKTQSLDTNNIQNLLGPQPYPKLGDSALGNTTNASSTATGDNQNQTIAFISSKVAHDVETNSLVLFMSPSEYTKIDELIKDIDVPRKQVMILGMVAEVSLDKVRTSGANLQVLSPDGLLASFRGGLTQEGLLSALGSGQFTIGTLGGGQNQTINVSGRDVAVPTFFAFLGAATNTTDFNLISSPRVLTSDHKEGIVEVGDVVPFATGARFDNNGQPLVTYDYKKVGINLKFTPHISQSDTLRLDLEEEVQEVTSYLQQNLGGFGYAIPLISNRSVKTTVSLKEGETLLIGGLIQKRTLDVINKVPILGDIPLIDNFFKTTNKEDRKTTLFIALTPYIVQHPDEIARLDRPYEQFLNKDGTPRDADHEPRPPVEKHAVPDPLAPLPKPAPAEGSLLLADLRVADPKLDDSLRQARVRMKNSNPFEVEVTLRQQVRSPEGIATETYSSPQRLAPGEERDITLPAYRFTNKAGEYVFDVSAWVGEQQISRLPVPRRVLVNP